MSCREKALHFYKGDLDILSSLLCKDFTWVVSCHEHLFCCLGFLQLVSQLTLDNNLGGSGFVLQHGACPGGKGEGSASGAHSRRWPGTWWCVTRRYTARPACLLAAAPGECHRLKRRVNKTAVALTASVTLLAHSPRVVVPGLCHEALGCCPVAWVRQSRTPGGWAGCRVLPRACCVG